MEFKVCKRCRNIFKTTTEAITCPVCSVALEATFKLVKRYIRSHPNATIVEVSEATHTSIEQIKYWIKDERIEYTKSSVIGIECERCGVSIKTGKLCNTCRNETVNILKSVYVKKDPVRSDPHYDENTRMRFLNMNNKNNKNDNR
ncbi:MAG: flagellar protein [Vallitaleaceae bacterium]|nr:flagellar protein [Vallitaleaceae bacterium]